MYFYTSDLHLGHKNVIDFDNRPFNSVEEMDETLINNWNNTVSHKDTVYIIGDFCLGKEEQIISYLKRLKGKKILIKGNHDRITSSVAKYYVNICDYKEMKFDGKRVILCHYPIPFYRSDYSNTTFMLYGHVHNTFEEQQLIKLRKDLKLADNRGRSSNKCNFYNAWLGYYDYKPVTLEQVLDYWKDKC